MKFGEYFIEFDRTGFPLVMKDGWNFYISLFPVSKYQFEIFLFDNAPYKDMYTDKWYREKLKLNPRREWWNCGEREWELFLTGLTFDEIKPFLRYLGNDFRLPKKYEWIKLYDINKEIRKLSLELGSSIKDERIAKPVFLWIEKLSVPLTDECILEMLEDGESFIGKPNNILFPNLWSPIETRKINWDTDIRKAAGFRVVRGMKCGF